MPKVPSLSAAERETTVLASDDDDVVRIWSAQRRCITKMRKSAHFTEIDQGSCGSTEWAEFTIPANRWSPLGVRHTRAISPERRQQSAARMVVVQHRAAGRKNQP